MFYIKSITLLFASALIIMSCGSDDDEKMMDTKEEPDVICDYTPCQDAGAPDINIVGAWNVFDDDDEADGDVTFRADGTGTAPED